MGPRRHSTASSDSRRLRVAIIGAGAAGLVSARECMREGHEVVIFDKGDHVGGVWVYSDETELEDELGINADRLRVHSSLYSELRTNLPRELMSFSDFPFTVKAMGAVSVDPRRFPRHEEVLRYLWLFALEYDLLKLARLNTSVNTITPLPTPEGALGPQWDVTYTSTERGQKVQATETFDAVISAIGNYHEPNLPNVPGLHSFPGKQIHCHNYRDKHRFKGQRVLVVGASFSGDEIARQIASVATQVIQCARSWASGPNVVLPPNLTRSPMVARLTKDGRSIFEDGKEWQPDSIVYCTGYKYAYPFLPSNLLDIEDFRVGHLYNHIFHPEYAPTLSFIGLIVRSVRFPQFEAKARYVARSLSGRLKLPSKTDMWDDIVSYYARLEGLGVPMRYAHSQGKGHSPDSAWVYNDKLATACGPDVPLTEPWRVRLSELSFMQIFNRPESFRDRSTEEEQKAYDIAAAACDRMLVKHKLGRYPASKL
ncbi:hypothetical protein WJX73_002005 [Symbiochloris irregularis]|uniref:Flavin-containing monooxygenase n=1 Tax=Symbiochloris irregularis TaxID=706552 RepID=A0AAW1PDT7_9CHLO